MPTPATTLRSSLEKHNETFEHLLQLIPAQYYVLDDKHDEQLASKYQKHSKKQKMSKQTIKEASKKAKRDKLDPANHKSIIDIQNENIERKSLNVEDNRMAFSDEDEAMNVDIDGMKLNPMPEDGGIEALRKKLHAKVALLRRGGQVNGEAGDKDSLLEERRRQRAVMRERRRKETKEKIRKEEEMKPKKKGKEKEHWDKGNVTKTQLLVPDPSQKQFEAQDNMTTVLYSSLAGSSKRGHHLKTTTDPQQALQQLASHKEKLASMSEEKRKAIEEKEKWAKAEARLEGVKVHDDEVRLKKAAKRKEKEKTRSKSNWDTKREQVAAAMAARQKKREDNIALRNERRKEKQKKKARPGFEGKSFGKRNQNLKKSCSKGKH